MTPMAKNFLSGPGPEVGYHRVDFGYVNLPEYLGLYAVILDNVLSPEECQQLIQLAEAQTGGMWEPALVNVGNNQQRLIADVRDCGRIIWDDRDMVEKIWRRVERFVPEIKRQENVADVTGIGPAKRKEVWEMTRLNERMRFLKYGPKQYFRREYANFFRAEKTAPLIKEEVCDWRAAIWIEQFPDTLTWL